MAEQQTITQGLGLDNAYLDTQRTGELDSPGRAAINPLGVRALDPQLTLTRTSGYPLREMSYKDGGSRKFGQALRPGRQDERFRKRLPHATETPPEHMDPAALDLTPLVNALINSSQSGSRQLFSLLSVTSHSSLALHKLTLLVYNISGIRSLEAQAFRRRFCYCVTNETNDLTDFTALLLDVMGNSTSYVHELFKSSSILSVSQRNNSGCIYICVMAGKSDSEVSALWESGSVSPLFNQTVVEGPDAAANFSSLRLPAGWLQLPTDPSHVSPSGTGRVGSNALAPPDDAPQPPTAVGPQSSAAAPSRTWTTQRFPGLGRTAHSSAEPAAAPRTPAAEETSVSAPVWTSGRPAPVTAELPDPVAAMPAPRVTAPPLKATTSSPATGPGPPTTTAGPTKMVVPGQGQSVQTAAATRTSGPGRTTTNTPLGTEQPGCPWRRPGPRLGGSGPGGPAAISPLQLQPCVLELCRFYSRCLCRPAGHQTAMKRYCDDSHLWYEHHATEVCRRVGRVSVSRSLKQRCLTKMCKKV
ncbi:HERV-H LTR-associating protein 1 [Cololabis saira]|uniref:HERV-H LTR-associating protein 1 n=1 Tax=Cololabis saira TaxID=129043 RepID=UPI002AD4E83F|nr:HERV-H LTR-associating protein 1 [Cololabis saira]